MIFKIKSENKYLLDVLFKNPDTDFGLYFKPLKNGQIVGNIINEYEYEVIFQDTKFSYMPEDSNQVDFQSYSSPLVILHICNELFGHILKSKEEYSGKEIKWLGITQGEADNQACQIEIPSFYIDSNWYRNGKFLPSKYFGGVEVVQQSNRIFKLTINAKSIFEAFNLLALVCLFTHVTNDYGMYTYIDDLLAQKYGRILTNIEQVPYFVFYLFIMKAVKSERQFRDLKPIFESYLSKYGLEANLVLEGTYRQRIKFILEHLELDIPILDIGCGEFTYYKKLMDKQFAASYYAIDKDVRFEQMGNHIARRYDADNLFFTDSIDNFVSDEKVNILMTEVIEHNPMDESIDLIRKALSYNFNKIIITTPNVEFNRFYIMETDMRHDDHYFELTTDEFRTMMEECTKGMDIRIDYFQLGDSLNGIQPTQGCVINK